MKNYLLLMWIFLACACASSTKPDDIEITFDVQHPTLRQVVLVYQMTVCEIPLDEQGHAVFTLRDVEAAHARLFYGQQEKQVYVEKGDRVRITFDGNDYLRTFKFEGEKSPVVDYLNSVTLMPLVEENYALPLTEFVQKVEQKEQESRKLLDAHQLGNIGKFEKMEEGRIRYGFGSALIMYPVGYAYSKDSTYRPGQAYYDAIRAYWVEDEDWVDVREYRTIMIELAHVLDEANRNVAGYYPKTVAEMRYIADNVRSEKVKQTLLHHIAASHVDQFGIKDITDMENIYHTYVKDTALLADYKAKFDKWDLASPGKPSPDFEAVDIDGKEYSLKDFKGKYVYIDMWATWCAPCKRELPFLKKLEERFAGKDIVFLGLSIDYDKTKWEERVKSGELAGVQLHIGPQSSFKRAYNIDGIPRFILLDKEGKIINNNMSRPSSEDTEHVLDALEGI